MTPEEIESGKIEVLKVGVGEIEQLEWLKGECITAQSKARAIGNDLVNAIRVIEEITEKKYWGLE